MAEKDELIESFTKYEVETAQELLDCIDGPVTADSFRRLLLLFLRGHYASADNYQGFEHLGCYTWSDDEETRTIEIEFSHSPDDRKVDAYPGIFVSFGQQDFVKHAMGNFAGHSQDRSRRDLSKESVALYIIHHVANKATDAYDLAEMTGRVFTAMADPMARNAGATGFEVMGMRLPERKKSNPYPYYTVAIPVQIKYNLAVSRTHESHRIRQILTQLTTES